jgi:D-sedoheptulose 7-phosphate isomerase
MLISEVVKAFQGQVILVTGDTYIDREIYGQVERLAPEAPVPVVKASRKRSLPAGAANVAKSIASLGGDPLLFGRFGSDAASREILFLLESDRIRVSRPSVGVPSFLPERFRIFAANQQVIQLLRKAVMPEVHDTEGTLAEFLAAYGNPSAVVVYDQGYGAVAPDLLTALRAKSDSKSCKLIIDAHPPHVSWYGEATLFTFNAEESLEAARNLGFAPSTTAEAGKSLSQRLNSNVIITEGGHGISVFPRGDSGFQIPAVKVPLSDRAGAGDSVTAVLALGLASGANLRDAVELANKAAGIVVAKPGIAYVKPEELVDLFKHEISGILLESAQVKHRLIEEQLPVIESLVKAIIRTYQTDKKVCAFGNGGSAADANHLITELVGRFLIERKGLPALSFSANEILMTSIANDYGYENTFARQVEAFVRKGDLVVAFSTSGKSPNVIKALDLAREKGATTAGFTGRTGGLFPEKCDICIRVPSDSTPRIQESHLAVVHIICELLEKELASTPRA